MSWLALTFGCVTAWASFSGQLKSSTDYYPTDLGKPTTTLVPYLSADLAYKAKFSKAARFQFRGLAITNPEAKSAPEKIFGDVPEGFFELKAAELKLRLGMDTVNWGVVDVSSPSDVVNTQVLFHPTRTFKRGAPMAELLWDRKVFGFHAVYIPWQARPLLPSTDSRWLPRRFLVNIVEQGTRVVLPPQMEYEYLGPQTLDHALNNNAGLKLFSHLGNVDLQLTHFEGASPSPKARPRIFITTPPGGNAVVESPVQLAPVTYRVRTTGVGATLAFEHFIVRAESAYQHTISRDDLLQPWSWSNVAAFETNVNVGTSTVTWLAQYYYTRNPQQPDNLISSSYRLFDDTALLGARIPWDDRTTVTVSGLYVFDEQGLYWSAGFDQKLTDALRWGLAWRDFSAARDGLLRTYERNDHASLDLTYFF